MKIETLKDKDEYLEIHGRVFGRTDVEVPEVVFVGRNDSGNAVAFVAGFWNTHDHFYIQYAGVLPEYQKSGYLRYFVNVLDGNISYSLSVVHTNVSALKIALSTGFIPVGFYLQNDSYFVQLERGKING